MLATRLPLRLALRVGQGRGQSLVAHPASAAISQSFFSQSTPFAAGRPKKLDSELKHPRRPKSTATKDPTTKKSTTKKPTTKKPATKKPATTKPATEKAPASKRKEYTPEQIESKKLRAQARKDKEKIAQLKAKALSPPGSRPVTAWNAYVKAQTSGPTQGNGVPQNEMFSQSAQAFRNLASTEREHYNHVATEMTQQLKREFETWIQAYTPLQILEANRARKLLRSKTKGTWKKIVDDRRVKLPQSSFMIYHQERYASGDFKGIPLTQAVADITNAWKALPASEKKVYQDLAEKDKQRYAREHTEVYGFEQPSKRGAKSSSDSDA